MKFSTISSCRLCGSQHLDFLFSLGLHHINAFPDSPEHDTLKCPIDLMKCLECGMVQQCHTAPSSLLYSRHYWFKSATNKKIALNLKDIAEQAMALMKDGETILDIGANDGTLLSFIGNVFKSIAVEPADNFQEELKTHADVVYHDFFPVHIPQKAKVITAIGMFYDLAQPVEFLKAVKQALKKDGVFITEMMTAKQMVEESDLGNLCHEHLMFYTWETICKLFKDSGLEIFSIELNLLSEDGKGYRILARHWKKGHVDFKEGETNFKDFFKDIQKNRKDVLKFLKNTKGKVYIYGASTKANTILQYYEIGPELIEGAIDKDSSKVGKYLLTGIPIVDESYIKKADFLWCIPYPFLDYFRSKEDFDGVWFVSAPKFEVIN